MIQIPAKEWNAMKEKMEDTSLPEWQTYYADLQAHENYYANKEPFPWQFNTPDEFRIARSRWEMDRSCFAPNKPGYLIANND